jgi:hypothetical protein
MSHDHDHLHDFGEATEHERSLMWRNQLLHIATEVYCASLKSETGPMRAFTAVEKALELIQCVDRRVVERRVEVQEDE